MSEEDRSDQFESGASKWNSIVPELYFDLISRIPPGTVLILGLVWAFRYSPNEAAFSIDKIKELGWAPVITLFFLLLGAGHSVGILLTPIGALIRSPFVYTWQHRIYNWNSDLIFYIHCRFKMVLSVKNNDSKKRRPVGFKEICKEEQVPQYSLTVEEAKRVYRLINEFLKSEDNQAKIILPKMQAEAALSDNLAPAIFFSFLVFVLHNGWGAIPPLAIKAVLGGIVLSIIASWYRHRAEIRRQFGFLRIVIHREENVRSSADNLYEDEMSDLGSGQIGGSRSMREKRIGQRQTRKR